jgi:hypothetical protein
MDPKLLAILKKAKAIDKAAEKFDTGAVKRSQTPGLTNDRNVMSESYSDYNTSINESVEVGSEMYREKVQSSKLPAAIQKAMLENPIPQLNPMSDIDDEAIRELRGVAPVKESVRKPVYSEDDEIDMFAQPTKKPEIKKRKMVTENFETSSVNVDEAHLRKLIASEISKALPKIIENYFESRLVKENVQFKAGNTIFSGNVMPMPNIKKRNNN